MFDLNNITAIINEYNKNNNSKIVTTHSDVAACAVQYASDCLMITLNGVY